MNKTITAAYLYATGRLRSLAEDERGAGMAEYTLLLALVAIALVAFFTGLANAIGVALNKVITELGGTAVSN